MKIDIHVHTKKIKSGDPETRNIEAKAFGEIIRNTEVKILAITNHNHFDLKQFEELQDVAKEACQIWPGVELDIATSTNRAHLIVIANPSRYKQFDSKLTEIIKKQGPDTFTTTLEEVVKTFEQLDCIYIAHYLVKKPNLSDDDIEQLSNLLGNSKRILKEATNSISAGVYITHGHNSIFGSDIQDWQQYVEVAKTLPELRLPVESFEQFCLLLEKDEATINTVLNKKVKENIEIAPFGPAELIRIDVFNDINILFGSKGTGKTAILEQLSKYFNAKGFKTSVYKSNDTHVDQVFDLKGNQLKVDLDEMGIDSCSEEINLLKTATEEEVTSISKYGAHFSMQETNKISRKLKIKDLAWEDTIQADRHLKNVATLLSTFETFDKFTFDKNKDLTEHLGPELLKELKRIMLLCVEKLKEGTQTKLFGAKSIRLLNHIVKTFVKEISKKTGLPEKPTQTGFSIYARNRIQLEIAVNKCIASMNKMIEPEKRYAGSLGDKGDLYCQTSVQIQNGNFINSAFTPLKKKKKGVQKSFATKLSQIQKHIYHNSLFEKISELNELEGIEEVESINDLLLFHRHFLLNEVVYHPSNGESSMILLHQELKEDKEIYLIDEPEKSLGNDYINDVIVPLLKEKALLGSKIIIATHDANIAVRTLPYNSIYRKHEADAYYTLTGNPFLNKLKCIFNSTPDLDWKEISMKTLEGGRAAFGERGKIYGK